MRERLWRLVARVVLWPDVLRWVMARAQRTPYTHITNADDTEIYMCRFWVFNPYGKGSDGEVLPARWSWLPSIRLHHIMRPDHDRHLHDHPWNARTIVLDGCYYEERYLADGDEAPADAYDIRRIAYDDTRVRFLRGRGYTGRLLFGEYHRIIDVSAGGVWTMFITWRKRGTWGFMVDGRKVPWREYLGIE